VIRSREILRRCVALANLDSGAQLLGSYLGLRCWFWVISCVFNWCFISLDLVVVC
jgi:hypothetical protein